MNRVCSIFSQILKFSIGYPVGHMRQIILRKPQVTHVKQCLKNYYTLKAALEEICELNQQLLRAEPAVKNNGGKKGDW